MKIALLDRMFTIAALVLGLYITISGWNYGLYRNAVPGPGFFPAIAGLLMTVLAAAILLRDLAGRERLKGEIVRPVLLGIAGVTAAVVGFVFAAPFIGMAAAAAIAMIVIGYLTEEPHRKGGNFRWKLIGLSIGTVIACHILFGMIIRVPLVTGPLGF
ncbi:tripartite tricarboxylate transporter TctB family protein [Rhizobium sp. TRM96647]|uniref:tripartite tricarboxylate transporter TctB family protein n=1 Tax=unclassified Rhizobium TaxID=2613769 RepID=UPI0021E91F5B|nr:MULTISPECIES: tripartite tricarboxylate transporter TctB family protein [unclassified Rhizobium]MCV3736200.1 tripartite tricarboxylate transporter TctB family protein [Rhizobium sp. TRM96647]MCV3758138.1 tripartite tricarboxylate transporter TctB family protein [Rhizobium sp. TRM96650]